MRVKICGIKVDEDINVLVKANADAAGFLVGQLYASKDFILPSTAARLAKKIPPYITPVLVTQLIHAESILELVLRSGITTVQLHGRISVDEVKNLRESMSDLNRIILATYMNYPDATVDLSEYYPLIDAIILDTYNRETGEAGGTGLTHDWKKSREFVDQCPLPVILAGGLTPENVGEAIGVVRPYGVDANTSLKNTEDGTRDLKLCCDYVKNARSAYNHL